MRLAVVIPYFQRREAILSNALRSIAAQRLPTDCRVEIIVVDDGSPIPAAHETANVTLPSGTTLQIVEQANAGPGAARNTALALLRTRPPDFVAFLDSDDSWEQDHLAAALDALGNDADFYFCDHNRFDIEGSYFKKPAIADGLQAGATCPLSSGERLGIWQPAFATEAFATEYYSMTSTVVTRWSVVSTLKFDTELRNAGEDALFWVDCARHSRLVVFSMGVHVHCGRGVNIYNGNFDWGSDAGADRFGYLALMYLKKAGRCPDNATVKSRMRRAEIAYAYLFARRALAFRRVDTRIVRAMFRSSPSMVFRMPWRALQYPWLKHRVDWHF